MFHDQWCACMRCEAPAHNLWPGGYEMLEYPGEVWDLDPPHEETHPEEES